MSVQLKMLLGTSRNIRNVKGILCEVHVLGGSALPLFLQCKGHGTTLLYTTNNVNSCILINQTVKNRFYQFKRMQW